jgi:hypothetical protein
MTEKCHFEKMLPRTRFPVVFAPLVFLLLLLLFLSLLSPLLVFLFAVIVSGRRPAVERHPHGHVVCDLVHFAQIFDRRQSLDGRDPGRGRRRRWRSLADLEGVEAVVVVAEADPFVDRSAFDDANLKRIGFKHNMSWHIWR